MVVAGLNVSRRLLACGSAAVVLACGGTAAAQNMSGSSLGLPAEGMAGAGLPNMPGGFPQPGQPIERRFDVLLLGTAVYDSNVAQGGKLVQNARGVTPADEIYTPSASINALLPVGPGAVFVDGQIGYDFHQSNTKLQSERINMSAGGETNVGPCGGSLSGSFLRGQSDLSDLSLAVTHNIQQTISGNLGARCTPLTGVGVYIGVSYAQTTNDSDGALVADSHMEGVNGGVSYTNELLGLVSVNGSYNRTYYDDVLPGEAPQPSYGQVGASISISRQIGLRLNGEATLGITHVLPGDAPVAPGAPVVASEPAFTGLTGSGSLVYRVNDRLSATLIYSRAVNPSLQLGADYQLVQTVAMTVGYTFSQRLFGSLGGTIDNRSFEGIQTTLMTTGVKSDNGYGVNAALRYTIGDKTSLSLTVDYQVRNADPAIFDYSSYRIGLTASRSF
ncbi:outer membrane beta-barrel protein [Phenylobacterium sp.]|uniref:outer membrane beta-barrel protein n=1 Tax=Phenylobacterium sp. TaxID=1871053 RepID=UPI001202C5FF|nr:outer membrane beta-barrel protein [Phenylobacterium sp.]THD65107.1 MAG: hypothetical protein E8A49_00065 [Phenylobacterium sp.]